MDYTLNLYPTNNRLLLNGKDIDSFMNCHLPTLHEIMCTPIRNRQLRSLSQLNITGLENSTRPLVFTSASGCRASENFDISGEN